MSKKIMYECDICHRTVERSYIKTFIKLSYRAWSGHDICKFHICLGCLSVWRALSQTGIEEWKNIDSSNYYKEI